MFLLIAQGVLFTIIAENKPSEVLVLLLLFVACSEFRIYFQKLALIQEEKFHERKQDEEAEKNRQELNKTVIKLEELATEPKQ